MKPIVSVITPCCNCEKYIADTIYSALNQTFKDFELIIVDDVSSDNTVNIIKNISQVDKRIKLIQLNQKIGASGARNKALLLAQGKYIAFLDGDDLWKEDKLEKQIAFMEQHQVSFCYCDYEYIDENSNHLNLMRISPNKVSYLKMLLGDSIGCLTVMYDASKLGTIQIPRIEKRNDYALWCTILKRLKKGYKCHGTLAFYRKSKNSLSSENKVKLLKYHYIMHRRVNQFNPLVSLFFTWTNGVNYLINRIVRDSSI